MKTGTDSIGAICDSPLKKCAAKMPKLPVMWAVNSPGEIKEISNIFG